MSQNSTGKIYFSDSPIDKPEQDILGRNAFVEQFAKTIINRQSEESLVIAFYGPWGAGKSSVLNLLQERIKSQKADLKIGIVRFDPWYFNSQEQLLQTFFAELSRNISQLTKSKNLLNIFKRYANTLSSIAVEFKPKFSLGPVSIDLGNVTNQSNESPEQLRSRIQASISGANAKVLILVDNLDRLDPPELLLMFKLVRLCSDFPGFIFILAFDHAQVLNLLKRGEVDVNFLEKMIQVDIDLPAIEQEQVDRMVMNSIDEIIAKEGVQFSPEVSERFFSSYRAYVSGTLITNLRTAKRYLNAVTFSYPLIKHEVDYADFLQLEILRVFYPEIHESIYMHRAELISNDPLVWDNIRGLQYEANTVRLTFFRRFGESLAGLGPISETVVKGLMCELFPAFRNFIDNPDEPHHATASNEDILKKRLANINHFSKYFQLQTLSYDVSISELEQFIHGLNQSTDENGVVPQFERYSNEHKLSRFYNKLSNYLNGMTPHARETLIRAVAAYSKNLVVDPADEPHAAGTKYSSPAMWESVLLTLKILSLINNETAKNALVTHIIINSTSIIFAMAFVVEYSNKTGMDDGDERTLLRLLDNRIQQEIVEPQVNIFDMYPTLYGDLFVLWAHPAGLGMRGEFESYFYRLIQSRPEVVVKFLTQFMGLGTGDGNTPALDYEGIKTFINLNNIVLALNKLPSDEMFSDLENQAIQEFKQCYMGEFPEMIFRGEVDPVSFADQEDDADDEYEEEGGDKWYPHELEGFIEEIPSGDSPEGMKVEGEYAGLIEKIILNSTEYLSASNPMELDDSEEVFSEHPAQSWNGPDSLPGYESDEEVEQAVKKIVLSVVNEMVTRQNTETIALDLTAKTLIRYVVLGMGWRELDPYLPFLVPLLALIYTNSIKILKGNQLLAEEEND